MNFGKNKTELTAIAIVLMFAMAASLVALPTANAQATKQTYAFIGAKPNPVGVGQEVLLHFGITIPTRNVNDKWRGLTVTVTRPDVTTETLGPFDTDSTGGTGTVYRPTMAGNYTLQAHFPEQWYNFTGWDMFGGPSNTLYKASDSDKLTLVVQEEPIPYYPGHPLPIEFWTRPIDAQLREWYEITGNWLSASWATSGNRYAPYNDGPETAHILWTKGLTMGGLVGGSLGQVGYGTGDAYEGLYSTRLIVGGRLYYTEGGSTGTVPVVYHCVDLHTGEELWSKTFLDNKTLALAQDFYFESYNYQGTFEYLWVSTGGYNWMTGAYLPGSWYAFDAYSGDWRFTIDNVPTGTTLTDEKGGLYVLKVDLTNGWMALWNMTHFGVMTVTPGREYYSGGGSWGDNVHFLTLDAAANTTAAKAAWVWNVTIPDLPGSVQATFFGDRVIGSNLGGGFGGGTVPADTVVWGISLKSGEEGRVLFNTTWKTPSSWITGNQRMSWAAWSQEDKVGVLWSMDLRQHYGVSLETGQLMWGPTPSQYYLDMWEGTGLTSHLIAYGRLYACGVSGIVYCYDVTTGDLLWTYEARDPYTESSFSNNWWLGIAFITDGKSMPYMASTLPISLCRVAHPSFASTLQLET
ncbi:MAG: hypothetical protein QXX34_01950 [Candidatus Bathyarchaeia archaeon]